MGNSKVEEIHLRQFLTIMFPQEIKTERLNPPEPDFRIALEGKIIGIEHSRLIRLPDSNRIDIMAHTQIADKIVRNAESLFNKKNNICLSVDISF